MATSCRSPGSAGFAPTVSFETEDYIAVLGLVSAGLGVALVPDLILAAAHTSDVATLSLTPASRRQIHAVTTDDLQRVPAVEGHARGARARAPAGSRSSPA